MQRRVQKHWFHQWREVGAPFSSQSWAGGHQSEWARGSRTPSDHSPGETARYTWGSFSSGSPRAPRTCSDRSWAGRWPRRADSASCPCCKHRGKNGVAVRAPAVSSEVMMSAHTNEEHLSDALWVASSRLRPTANNVMQYRHFTHV